MVHYQVSIGFLALLVLSASADSSSSSPSVSRGAGTAAAEATADNDKSKSGIDDVGSRYGHSGMGYSGFRPYGGHGTHMGGLGSQQGGYLNGGYGQYLYDQYGQICCPCVLQHGAANSAANSQAVANVKPEINIYTKKGADVYEGRMPLNQGYQQQFG